MKAILVAIVLLAVNLSISMITGRGWQYALERTAEQWALITVCQVLL